MNSSLLVALAVLGLGLVIAIGVLACRREQARDQALRAWAAAGRWQLVDEDVGIQHADFNRRQRVTAASAELATDLLSPRVVEQLLTHDDVSLRVAEGWALAWTPGRVNGPSVDERLAMLRAVVDGIPRFVWLDHGHDPGTLTSPLRKEAP